MLFYFVIIIVASAFAGIANTQKKHHKQIAIVFFCASAIVMFVPLAMRGMGVDYEEYYRSYLSTSSNWLYVFKDYLGRPEPLYLVLNYISKQLFNSFQGVVILCALISIGFTYAGLYKFKDKVNLGITVWCFGFLYYLFMFGLNRMMIAVAIATWALHYYFSKQTKAYMSWVVIAGLFHYSAFLLIPLFFVCKWMDGKDISFESIKWVRVIVSVVIILVAIYQIVPYVFGNFSWFYRYRGYFDLSFTPAALNNNAATLVLIMILLFTKNGVSAHLGEYKSMLNMMIVYVVLSLASTIMPIHRITYYYYPVCVLLYGAVPASRVLAKNSRENRLGSNIILYSLLFLMGILWISQLLNSNLWGPYLVPYRVGSLTDY